MRIGAARKRVWPVMVAAGVVASASSASPARAAPDCPGGLPKKNILLQGQSTLESIVFDRRGRLFFTNSDSLLRLDRRGSAPHVVTAIPGRGGLELAANGQLLVGANNDNTSAVFWGRPETGGTGASAEIWRVDPDTGAHSVLVHGLPMANGIARSADGAVYASDDFSSAGIGRVLHGHLDRFWATVNSANGLVIDPTGRYLFAAQTFQPAAVARVELAHPDHVETYWSASGSDIFGGPDGITRDERGRLARGLELQEVERVVEPVGARREHVVEAPGVVRAVWLGRWWRGPRGARGHDGASQRKRHRPPCTGPPHPAEDPTPGRYETGPVDCVLSCWLVRAHAPAGSRACWPRRGTVRGAGAWRRW